MSPEKSELINFAKPHERAFYKLHLHNYRKCLYVRIAAKHDRLMLLKAVEDLRQLTTIICMWYYLYVTSLCSLT